MAYYPMPLPDDVADVSAHRRGKKPYPPPRVWKGVATLAAMFLLVGAVTGIGVLEADNLHSVPISSSSATAPAAATGSSPATIHSPNQPGPV